ncbi:MAG TPA: hypothetical protein PLG10_02905 [Candidatus Dojkabacteria bacterium]|nr:hypothetical protein [Candidatus Dojkabacteria bacterium]
MINNLILRPMSLFKLSNNKLLPIKNSLKFWNVHTSFVNVFSEEDVDYAIMLAKQVFKKFEENN